MFATLHSMVNSFKSDLFHLTGKSNSQKCRAAKVKDGIISDPIFLGNTSVNRYKKHKAQKQASFYRSWVDV